MRKKDLIKQQKKNAINALLKPCKEMENKFYSLFDRLGVNPFQLTKKAKQIS